MSPRIVVPEHAIIIILILEQLYIILPNPKVITYQ